MVLPRLRLVGILTLITAAVPFTSSYWIIKLVGLSIGLAFFGDPLFTRGLALLNEKVPEWKEGMDLQR